jgi:hypothetical protein
MSDQVQWKTTDSTDSTDRPPPMRDVLRDRIVLRVFAERFGESPFTARDVAGLGDEGLAEALRAAGAKTPDNARCVGLWLGARTDQPIGLRVLTSAIRTGVRRWRVEESTTWGPLKR